MKEVIDILEKDERIILLKKKKIELLNNKELISMINNLKQLDIYSNQYKKLKLKLFENSEFVEYKQLENEIYLLIMEINNKLKCLTNERGCI